MNIWIFTVLRESTISWPAGKASFPACPSAVAGGSKIPWDEETRMDFSAAYVKFHSAYLARGGGRLPIKTGDALLS